MSAFWGADDDVVLLSLLTQLVAQDAPFAPPATLSRTSFPHGSKQSSERSFLVMRRSGVQIPEAALSRIFWVLRRALSLDATTLRSP